MGDDNFRRKNLGRVANQLIYFSIIKTKILQNKHQTIMRSN